MEIKDIRRIVEMMKTNDLSKFSMKDDGFELEMKRGSSEAPQVVYASAPAAAPVAAAPAGAPAAAPAAAPEADSEDLTRKLVRVVAHDAADANAACAPLRTQRRSDGLDREQCSAAVEGLEQASQLFGMLTRNA